MANDPVVLTAEDAEMICRKHSQLDCYDRLMAIALGYNAVVPVRTEAEERERFAAWLDNNFGKVCSWQVRERIERLLPIWLAAKRDAGVLKDEREGA